MARITTAQLNARIAALESALAAKDDELAHLASRVRHDYVEVSEYRRVQALLRTTQQFYAKEKRRNHPAPGAGRPDPDALKRFFEAHPERRSATPAEIAAYA